MEIKKLCILTLLFFMLFFIGCTKTPLERALEIAGKNRAELEKVLDHFRNDNDPRKYLAAQFLIENMPGHYAVTGKGYDRHVEVIDSACYATDIKIPYIKRRALYQFYPHIAIEDSLHYVLDVDTISSEYFIHSIERTFQLYETTPWLRHVPWEDFCNYLLPYRTGEEPLDHWKDSIFITENDRRVMEFFNDSRYNITRARLFFEKRYFTQNDNFFGSVRILKPDSTLHKPDCIEMAASEIAGLRMSGIPCAIDFVPRWGDHDGRHHWVATIDDVQPNAVTHQELHYHFAKVLRKTFAHEDRYIRTDRVNEYVPGDFATPFHRDVTEKYATTSDLTVKLRDGHSSQYVYLAVFNAQKWEPVWWAERKGRKATFTNMGREVLYLPVAYTGGTQYPAAHPFILNRDGSTTEIIADTSRLQTLRLTRKCDALYTWKWYWSQGLAGSYIEGADNPEFKNGDTLAIQTVDPLQHRYTLKVDSTKKYRYWRYMTLHNDGYIGELRVYDPKGDSVAMKNLAVINKPANYNRMFDNNVLTITITKGGWVGFDFGKPTALGSWEMTPRSDDNGIVIGQDYELLYWNGEGWQSKGSRVADQRDLIIFDSIPTGGLYWLRNLTKGREERPLTYENGKARFW